MMLGVGTLLLGAAAVDRQDKKEGGVYKKLFASLNLAVDSLQRKEAAAAAGRSLRAVRNPRQREEESELKCVSSIGSGDSAVSSDSVLQSGHHTPRSPTTGLRCH
ncbi:hypothetical protein GBAR_LOCUS1508 [Geodia barretti]|uniref:Uncharacterized protein n=1 Tax=Geodia barretti TaxID=519541 RepID=A0AA35QX20_GEOBA|nr:hypothetical protein GBAR_LOCUS1508 [Geodia barretti]